MNHQKENQTSQLPQNNLLTPPVLYRSIANERIYDDDVTLPQVQNSTDLPVLYRSITNERIYDDDVTLPQVQNSTDLPVIYRSIANERIYDDDVTLQQVQNSTDLPVLVRSSANERIYDNDDDILSQLVQQDGLWCNSSPLDDTVELSQEMTYMSIEHN